MSEVEEWARTAHFEKPVRLGEVEAAILSRPPVDPRWGWWLPIYSVVVWILLGLLWCVQGGAAPVLGAVLVWFGIQPGADDVWLSVARMVFAVSAFASAVMAVEMRKEGGRKRDLVFALALLPGPVGCVVAYLLLSSSPPWRQPWGLELAIVAAGILTSVHVLTHLFARPRPPRDTSKVPPLRGPRSDVQQARYVRTRERVLDILVQRRLLKLDESDRIRLREMPLGYWEEIDDVDERERRRILEYRLFGWREFTEADRRPWRRPR